MTDVIDALIGEDVGLKRASDIKPASGAVMASPPSGDDGLADFRKLFKFASFMSKSGLIPKHLQDKPTDCFIVAEMAQRTGASFLEIAQNLYVVHGQPSWKATFIIAQINRSRLFDSNIKFSASGEGKDLAVTAWTTQGGERLEKTVSMAMATKEGWTKNPKYQSMAEQMLTYRAACFFSRAYCPEIMFGMYTTDEIIDVQYSKNKEAPQNEKKIELSD